VAPAGEQREAFAGFVSGFGFGEDAGAGGDNCVRGNYVGIALAGKKFFGGEALRVAARGFALQRRFIDVRRENFGGFDADLAKQGQPPRAGGTKNYLKRNVIRPLVRS
jgi:hypothetical protein